MSVYEVWNGWNFKYNNIIHYICFTDRNGYALFAGKLSGILGQRDQCLLLE